jgi:hypothetical protein
MRINRTFLYLGAFLAALGGMLVAADIGSLDAAALLDAVRLWPVAVLLLGVAIVVRRTQAGLSTGVLAAALPGLVLGGAIAVVPRYAGDCGARGDAGAVATQQGTFDGPARVSLSVGCGSLLVHTASGSGWQLAAGTATSRAPSVNASGRLLTIGESDSGGPHVFDGSRTSWDLTLPTSDLDFLSMTVFANRSRVDLAGAHVGRLALTVNASDAVVDASSASVGSLSVDLNVGSVAVQLPAAGDLSASLDVGGGRIRVCAPSDLGVRVTANGLPRQITVEGLQQNDNNWQTANYATAAHRADLRVSVHFGQLEINPIGGCK